MQIRPLHEEEREIFAAIVRDSFVIPQETMHTWTPLIKMEATRGLYDSEGELLSILRLHRLNLWLGTRQVKMAGVTSVGTPPEHRRKGYLKHLLRSVMADERERGTNLIGLYPFEFSFYRKFGYELASVSQAITVTALGMSEFKSKTPGRWVERTAADWELFRSLYDRYCVGRFGRIERQEESWWQRNLFTTHDNREKAVKAFTWQDDKGDTRAYILYHFRPLQKEWSREMKIREMVWLDEQARYEIYSFIANHDSQADKISWETEPGDEFFAMLNDPRAAESTLIPGYMLRLLDVERALLERPWPAETASFSVAVRDDVLTWNDGRTYHVEVRQGRPELTAQAGSDKAGLACDVRTLAQLYAGYLSPMEAARLGKLEVRRGPDLERAQRLFSPPGQPASFMNDGW
jgi:predicted acetyltransferase